MIETEYAYFIKMHSSGSIGHAAYFLYSNRITFKVTPASSEDDDPDFNPHMADHMILVIPKNDQHPSIKSRVDRIVKECLTAPY